MFVKFFINWFDFIIKLREILKLGGVRHIHFLIKIIFHNFILIAKLTVHTSYSKRMAFLVVHMILTGCEILAIEYNL